MEINILGKTVDIRTNTNVIYAQINIPDYLSLVGEDFDEFSIQRRREKHKAYERMRKDIKLGALLPPITLAVKTELVPEFIQLVEENRNAELVKLLSRPNQVNILDGLQRTYILQDLKNENHKFNPEQRLLLEFWFEAEIRNLIYRIIVLNAGQKPMSMRHQLEVLFLNVKTVIEERIGGLEIFLEKDETRRTKPKKYAMDRLVSAYQGFLYRNPEIQKENIVAQQLIDENILEADEDELGETFDRFVSFLGMYSNLDVEICRVYVGNKEKEIPSGTVWFGSENVMVSFFSAISEFGTNNDRFERVINAINSLNKKLTNSKVGDDPIGLETFQKIIQGFPTRRVNVGTATRRLLSSSFKEYFRSEGEKSLEECWLSEAN